MARTIRHRKRNNKKTLYLVAFFCLVAFLSSEFSGLGMTGIFFSLAFSLAALVGLALVWKGVKHNTTAMLNGKPSAAEHLLAPGGYRRRRYRESWDEYAAQSVVVPTPNRPLQRGDIVQEALPVARPAMRAIAPIQARAVVPAQQLAMTNKKQWLNACLELAQDFNPRHTHIIGRGLTCIGMRGSGKSNFAALLLEQIWKIPVIPGVCFDYKVDFASLSDLLPNVRIGGLPTWEDAERYPKYWGIDAINAKAVGYEVRERGAQLVVQLSSYPDMDTQAQVMTGIIEGMFAWANDHRSNPLPAIVLLDEAQQFLPQSLQDSSISKAILQELMRWFKRLNEIGRSYGLQPLFFTQRAARLNKDVIGGSEIWVLMKQTMPQDLKACDELLGENVDRAQVTGFTAGDALVFEGGTHFYVHFDQRQSIHLNKTPTLEDAVKHYQNTRVPEKFTTPLEDDEAGIDAAYPSDDYDPLPDEEEQNDPQPTHAPVAVKTKQKTDLEIVVEYFKENPHVSFRAAAPILKIGGKDKLGELYREAKERGLLG
jgi:hypothetical protein